VVRSRGRELRLEPLDNGQTRVRSSKPWGGNGTQVGVYFGVPEDDMLDWAQVAADHAGGEAYEGRTSPWWYDSDSFYELCVAASPRTTVRALIEQLDGCSGAMAGKIAALFKNRSARELGRKEAEALLLAARRHARAVKPERLGTVGARPTFAGYGKALDTILVSGHRESACDATLPVVVEAWASVEDEESSATLLVNRTPAAAEMYASTTAKQLFVNGCGLDGDALPTGGHHYRLLINVQTPYMPITSDGKAPDLGRFAGLLGAAIKQAVSRAKRAAGMRDPTGPQRTFKQSILDHLAESIAHASGDGDYRFNERNLYYAVRPHVLEDVGELKYATFKSVITDYEHEHDAIPGMFRNERGVLIHPHSHEHFALGTLTVESYERPAWSFNKVLYIEKEGFFQTLLADGWAERHDCALMSSQGYATRAVKDLIDALGETEEPIEIFCVHDADASGTTIYESLQEATRARPRRTIEIVNLGLERGEAEEMGLACEELSPSRKVKPTAGYVNQEDHDWYQSNRYELNAMTAPQFIAWLDGKMEAHAKGKVVPPPEVMAERFNEGLYRLALCTAGRLALGSWKLVSAPSPARVG
jgi:hypothetical protein